eukprot:gene3982-4354_t
MLFCWRNNIPSGNYLAFTRLPLDRKGSAIVYVSSLSHGNHSVLQEIATSTAWGAQVGCQVQWGRLNSSDVLFYNQEALTKTTHRRAYGVAVEMKSGISKQLACPVYHVSQDGLFTVSPNLYKIQYTQQGYGLDYPNPSMQQLDLEQDGIYVNNVITGQCHLLYRLQQMADAIGISARQKRIYGFHTKWSSDREYILFVLRTLEDPQRHFFSVTGGGRVRVQHLLVLSAKGDSIRYLFSWASRPFRTVDGKIVNLVDANHPNWIPESHHISLNIAADVVVRSNSWPNKRSLSPWSTVVIDVDSLSSSLPLFHKQFQVVPYSDISRQPLTKRKNDSLVLYVAWEFGFGHPSFHSNGRHFLTDAYEKEVERGRICSSVPSSHIPIILVDTWTKQVTAVAQMRSPKKKNRDNFIVGGKEDRSWRCDVHPAWSFDFQMIVFNWCNASSGSRQVAYMHLNRSMLQ